MKLKIGVGAIIALYFVAGINVCAVEQKIAGNGKVSGFIQVFSEDILYLENEINNLMSECGKEIS